MSGWYGQKNYSDMQGGGNGGGPAAYTIAQIGCLITAFCNLERRFGKEVDPASLNRLFTQRAIFIDVDDGVKDDLGWASITAYDGDIHAVAGGAGWPSVNNAIVKFHYRSPVSGNMIDHFCLVADENAHTIIDSWDGVIKTSPYGEPVAWESYEDMAPQPVQPIPQPVATAGPGDYTVVAGDVLSLIAQRYNTTWQTLAEMNNIPNPSLIYPGMVLRLPINTTAAADSGPVITYEALPAPKQLHISRAGGAEKWGFGNVKKWSDFVSTGHAAENTNFTAVATATVPIPDAGETAAYYMDALAFGDFASTGQVATTTGFSWADVADGFVAAPTPDPTPAPIPEPVAPAPVPAPTPVDPTTPVVDLPPQDAVMTGPNAYKTTLKAFPEPELFYARASVMVQEMDTRRPDRQLYENQRVSIDGTFTKDGILYGLPSASHKVGYWFGIPMTDLRTEDELLSSTLELTVAERKRLHHDTIWETVGHGVSIFAGWLTKLVNLNKKKK